MAYFYCRSQRRRLAWIHRQAVAALLRWAISPCSCAGASCAGRGGGGCTIAGVAKVLCAEDALYGPIGLAETCRQA